MPHKIAPVPHRLSPKPSTRRLHTSNPRLNTGQRPHNTASSNKTPLAPQPSKPIDTVRFGPNVSAERPASGRDASVARYCTLIAAPASIAL